MIEAATREAVENNRTGKWFVFSLWTPNILKECILTEVMTRCVAPEVNINVPHQKPHARGYYPHNWKTNNPADQEREMRALLDVTHFKNVETSGILPVEVEVSKQELDRLLFGDDKTFGDVNRLLFTQMQETEDRIKRRVDELVLEKGATKLVIRKPIMVYTACAS